MGPEADDARESSYAESCDRTEKVTESSVIFNDATNSWQSSADLVGEVHVARGVHQVQLVDLAVLGLVGQPDGLRLDRDAALALQVHAVEHLVGHLALGQRAGDLDQPVGQGGFPVVDMGYDREIADVVDRGVGHVPVVSGSAVGGRKAGPRRGAAALR